MISDKILFADEYARYLLWDRRLLQSGILKYFQKDECVKKVYIENGREWILEIQYTFFCTLSTEIQ